MTAPQERPVPPEVVLGENGKQMLVSGFRQYLPCSAGCGFLIGCGDAHETVAHASCLERANADERLPMSEAERSLRIEVLWGRVERLEGALASVVGCLEGLLGDRPKRNTDDSLSFHPHWLNR